MTTTDTTDTTTTDTTTTDAATTETALDADDTDDTDTCGRDAWAWCPCRRHERQRARLVSAMTGRE